MSGVQLQYRYRKSELTGRVVAVEFVGCSFEQEKFLADVIAALAADRFLITVASMDQSKGVGRVSRFGDQSLIRLSDVE